MKRQHKIDVNTPERYDEIYFGVRTVQLMPSPHLMALLRMTCKGGKALDIGCGLGRYFPYFGTSEVTGLDFTQKVLDQAKADYPMVTVVNHDIAKNGLNCFEDESFDYIFCSEVIEHMENPQALVNEIRRVLKKDGIAIVTTPYQDRIVCEEHIWEFDWQDLHEMFVGYKNVAITRYFNVPAADWEHFVIQAQK